jgi:hypothetical protein
MYDVFNAFGVPVNEYKALEIKANPEKKLVRKKKVKLPKIEIPDYFKPLTEFDEDDLLAEAARDFLWEKYHMTQDDYPFFLSTGKTKSDLRDDQYLCRRLRPRIIIPAYVKDNMIYWQARIFVGDDDKKYVSASVENSGAVIYGLDKLYADYDKPLYVTEGFFDSWHVNGVAIIGNTMKQSQIEILNKTNRPKVVIPDLNVDGLNLVEQAVELGWGVSVPNILPETDICKAIQAYGKLYVIKSVVDKTYFGDKARFILSDLKNKLR